MEGRTSREPVNSQQRVNTSWSPKPADQMKLECRFAIASGRLLERRVADLRSRYASLQFQETDEAVDEHVQRCEQELTNHRNASLAGRLASVHEMLTLAYEDARIGNLHGPKGARNVLLFARNQIAATGRALGTLETSLSGLERRYRRNEVRKRKEVIEGRLVSMNVKQQRIEGAWNKLKLSVREDAKVDLESIKLCVAAFESPRGISSPFQKETQALKTIMDTISSKSLGSEGDFVAFEQVQSFLDNADGLCSKISGYLDELETAVQEYETMERRIDAEKTNVRLEAHRRRMVEWLDGIPGLKGQITVHLPGSGVRMRVSTSQIEELGSEDDDGQDDETELQVASRKEVSHAMNCEDMVVMPPSFAPPSSFIRRCEADLNAGKTLSMPPFFLPPSSFVEKCIADMNAATEQDSSDTAAGRRDSGGPELMAGFPGRKRANTA